MNGEPGEANQEAHEPELATVKSTGRTRISPEHPLMSDRHAYSVQPEVLRKIHTLTAGNDKFVMAEDVERNGVPSQSVSLNVRFWVDNGFLIRDGKSNRYRISPAASRYVINRALGVDKGRPALHAIVANSWFTQTARAALTTKPLMPREELQGELAMASGVIYETRKRSLASLVDMLEEAGVVAVSEDGVRLVEVATHASDLATTAPAASVAPSVPAFDAPTVLRTAPFLAPAGGAASSDPPPSSAQAPPMQGVRLTFGPFVAGPSLWRTVTGPGFILQVDPTRKTITWLKRHVELLEAEVAETEASTTQAADSRMVESDEGGSNSGGSGSAGGSA